MHRVGAALTPRPPDDEGLLLFLSDPGAIDVPPDSGPLALAAQVQLQPLQLQARFTRLAWSGGRYLTPNESVDTNIAVIGAKVGAPDCEGPQRDPRWSRSA